MSIFLVPNLRNVSEFKVLKHFHSGKEQDLVILKVYMKTIKNLHACQLGFYLHILECSEDCFLHI